MWIINPDKGKAYNMDSFDALEITENNGLFTVSLVRECNGLYVPKLAIIEPTSKANAQNTIGAIYEAINHGKATVRVHNKNESEDQS